jgi:hypothetical protein
MIDVENCKILLAVSAIGMRYASHILAQALPTGIDVWLERGGTVLCIVILGYLLKCEREERKERQKFHDDRDLQRAEKDEERETSSTAAREKLAIALEKLTEKIEKR